jgi:hypothetical protein
MTYNLGALIAFCLDANYEKGGICGGLVASRLLALHGVVPHILDLQFPIEKLDFNSMLHHKFISPHSCLNNLTFEITFFKKSTWKIVKADRLVHLPAPLLFNLDRRNGWSLMEHELDAYIEEHPPPSMMERQPRSQASPPTLRSFCTSSLIMIIHHLLHLHKGQAITMPMMTHRHGACIGDEIDLHLGQKPKLGGRYADDSLIYISYFVGTLCIHVSLSFLYYSCSYFFFPKHKKTKNIFVVSLCLPF